MAAIEVAGVTMDVIAIMGALPHRYPMLMIDRVTRLIPEESAEGLKSVTINEPHFLGHWPGNPVMPGVLIQEALFQLGGILCLRSTFGMSSRPVQGTVVEAVGSRWRGTGVVPGDQLLLEVTLSQHRGRGNKQFAYLGGVARVGDEAVLTVDEFKIALQFGAIA